MEKQKLDAVTFEILRHRLWTINDEAAATVTRVSGSPLASEGKDFNTAILTGDGEMAIMGTYVATHACVQEAIVRHVVEEYQDNPGIDENDMFLTNDPYYGALHQPDVTVVAPIHWVGKLIAWCGVTLHHLDVGGRVAGGFAVGAASIYEEAMPIPPIKLVEGGVVRRDIEREITRRSRVPEIFALDLRAQIAANNATKTRILDLIMAHGVERLEAVLSQVIDVAELKFRSRLKELPDGTWRHTSYIEHDGLQNNVYVFPLTMTKQKDQLILDFSEASPQAPGLINSCIAGLRGAVMSILLPMLCYDIPWSPAGVSRAVTILSKKGTIVDAEWPAGVSSSTTGALFAARIGVAACVAKMLCANDKYRDKAMATWQGSVPVVAFYGLDREGRRTVGRLVDYVGGAGARTFKDGVDAGGTLSSLSTMIPNVESSELRYPLLYVYRKYLADTGGFGKFRGGTSGAYAVTPHRAKGDLVFHVLAHGVEFPASTGISGGYPGATCEFALVRKSGVRSSFRQGHVPSDLVEIEGNTEVLPAKATTTLGANDILQCIIPGGGGYGDPLDRDPRLVLNDLANGLTSLITAKDIYGVLCSPEAVVPADIEWQRLQIRSQRRLSSSGGQLRSLASSILAPVAIVNEYIEIAQDGKLLWSRCRKCGRVFSSADKNYKDFAATAEYPVTRAGPRVAPRTFSDRFVLREFYCPGCWTMLDVEVSLNGSPSIWDVQLELNSTLPVP